MEAPSWMFPAPQCEHGTKIYATGTKQDSSIWHAWKCPDRDGCTREQGAFEFRDAPQEEGK